jgi:hypothetical protein
VARYALTRGLLSATGYAVMTLEQLELDGQVLLGILAEVVD